MKRIIIILILLLLLLLLVFFVTNSKQSKEEEKIIITHEMLLEQVEKLGNLEVVKYSIQDMMEFQKNRRWLPNSKAQVRVFGEVIGCIDLTKIQANDVYVEGDSVRLVLPMPEMCHYKLDHSRSQVYNVEYGLWETAELVDEAYKQAEQHLYKEALKMGIAEQSRTNSIQILTPLLRSLGFNRIYITFKTNSTNNVSEKNVNLDINQLN